MSFLLPLLGNVLGGILPGLLGGKGVDMYTTPEDKYSGGYVTYKGGKLVHHARGHKTGRTKAFHIPKRETTKLFNHLLSNEGHKLLTEQGHLHGHGFVGDLFKEFAKEAVKEGGKQVVSRTFGKILGKGEGLMSNLEEIREHGDFSGHGDGMQMRSTMRHPRHHMTDMIHNDSIGHGEGLTGDIFGDGSNSWTKFEHEHGHHGLSRSQLHAEYTPHTSHSGHGEGLYLPGTGAGYKELHEVGKVPRQLSAWIEFLKAHKGSGHTRKELTQMYHARK